MKCGSICRLFALPALLCLTIAAVAQADDLQTGPPPTPPTVTLSPDAKTAKDALAKLANTYQTANDLTYKSTLVVYGPPTTDGKPPATETLLITAAAEKPNKFSIKGTAVEDLTHKKLAEFLFSDGTDAYTYDTRAGFYEKLAAPSDGIDLPQFHIGGLAGAVDYSAEYASRMFFDDQPYDLSESATEDTDVQFTSSDKTIGNQSVLAITETYTGDHGVVTTLHVALDKTFGLPREVSEDLTTNGQTNTVFKEDFDSIHVGALPDDIGVYSWQPKAGTVTAWSPPAKSNSQPSSVGSTPEAAGGQQ